MHRYVRRCGKIWSLSFGAIKILLKYLCIRSIFTTWLARDGALTLPTHSFTRANIATPPHILTKYTNHHAYPHTVRRVVHIQRCGARSMSGASMEQERRVHGTGQALDEAPRAASPPRFALAAQTVRLGATTRDVTHTRAVARAVRGTRKPRWRGCSSSSPSRSAT